MHFATRATPINIDSKSHKTELKSSGQSYKVKIMPLVIYGLGGVHTRMHTFENESDVKKPGVRLVQKVRKQTSYTCVDNSDLQVYPYFWIDL